MAPPNRLLLAGGEGEKGCGWTIFAICFTALLLVTGSAFTLLEFYRADKRLKESEGYGSTGGERAAAL